MEKREQRGLELAATRKLRRKGRRWEVPSQSGNGCYIVDLKDMPTCSCPDFEARQGKCKHIYAVEFTLRREVGPDDTTTVTQTMRVTYAQDWPVYNAAQTHEKVRVGELLRGLCNGIVQLAQSNGRPRLSLADVVFGAVMKVYSTLSGRRAMSDLRDCREQGYMTKIPHYNSAFRYLEDPALTPVLKALVEENASPLKTVETEFAVDASGFSTSTFVRWFD